MAEAWFINKPRKRRRTHKKKVHARRRRRHQTKGLFMANRHTRRRRRRYRKNPVSRRHYRRNPSFISSNLINEVGYAAIGVVGTKIASGYALQTLGASSDIARIAVKLGVAYGVAKVGGMVLGAGKFDAIFLGGAVDAISDFVKTYLGSTIPSLAGSGYNLDFLHDSRVRSEVSGYPFQQGGNSRMNGYPYSQGDIYGN